MTKDDAAVRLVLEGKVQVIDSTIGDRGEVLKAAGKVQSSSGDDWYMVIIDPDGASCSCPYGQHHVLHRDSHKHDLALRLAVQIHYQKEEGQ